MVTKAKPVSGEIFEEAQKFGISLEQHEGRFNTEEVKFLEYGESGVGKTVFAASWEDVVFLDANHGMSSVIRQVGRIQVDDWDDLEAALRFLKESQHPYKTVVVDSLNDVQRMCMDGIIQDFPTIRRAYENLASQSDYGKMLSDFDKWVREVVSLSMNVILTCNVAPQVFETDAVQPQLIGKHTARNIAGMMDVIGYLYKMDKTEGGEKKDRIMVFDAVNHVTKDRSSLLPGTVKNPSHELLMKYWTEEE